MNEDMLYLRHIRDAIEKIELVGFWTITLDVNHALRYCSI